jgi:UDP-arabinose 4-epimerase
MHMRILVTGGAGYIGSHVCKTLAGAGYQPIAYDNLLRGYRRFVRWGALEVGDLTESARLRDVLQRHQPSSVVHLAGLASVAESIRDPAGYYQNNVVGTLILLEAIRETGIRSLVFSSSCATYGPPMCLPIAEDHVQKPINPYGSTKFMVEQILHDYGVAYGLRSVSLRYFNAAGADPEGEIGEHHDPETHAIPLAIKAAAGKGPPFTIFGTDYPTPDGTAVRDYIHVSDLAEAHVAALKHLMGEGASDSFNLGTGTGTSTLELLASVERVGGRAVPHVRSGRRHGDPPVLVADARKARHILAWKPRYCHIDEIVRTAWSWHDHADSGTR